MAEGLRDLDGRCVGRGQGAGPRAGCVEQPRPVIGCSDVVDRCVESTSAAAPARCSPAPDTRAGRGTLGDGTGDCLPDNAGRHLRSVQADALRIREGRVVCGGIDYRLGRQVLNLKSRVRFPVPLPHRVYSITDYYRRLLTGRMKVQILLDPPFIMRIV